MNFFSVYLSVFIHYIACHAPQKNEKRSLKTNLKTISSKI
ncbi:hypothetical protein M125_1614 [Bacteroides fragilis str. 3998T(B)3]|uniref:Uncharacterized protein n=1 Tax=Bacteroides fragilis str. 3998T(B)3 TaxID=1339316 RepID=A0A015VNX2_BACFG|nr:hypothetical protein M125_5824 [Bacteroides fragilis str. 3998T(B)3]EXY91663.1 hypothetical protein M125_1614 [Bacteroides fragilis str. 3998T(B)3]